jgi:hypothetical protein
MEKIFKFLERPLIKWTLFILVTVYPTVDFYLEKFQLAQQAMSEINIDWGLVMQIVPRVIYGLITGLFFLLFIKAQSAYYEVRNVQRDLIRLNQLYKERFKMIYFGDSDKLFSDFEKENWKRRLYQKEKDITKDALDKFVEYQYRFNAFEYGDKIIPKKN